MSNNVSSPSRKPALVITTIAALVTLLAPSARAQLLWTVGLDDGGWPAGDGGGANASFVQENGTINLLPGSPTSPEVDQQADNDYYFAGTYTTAIGSVTAAYGAYTPVGVVAANEEAAERAFAAADNDLRYHFNLPTTLRPFDLLSVTFDANNLHDGNPDTRYGIEVYFNGVLVQTQIVIRAAQLDVDYTTPQFSLASVNAQTGPGFDNIVSLKGINYNADGGGNWMGIDYVQLNAASGIPPIVRTTLINPANTVWDYNDATVSPGLTGPWTTAGYDTNSEPGWKNGPSLFGNDSAGIYDTAGQPFAGMGVNGFLTPWDRTGGRITFYARKKFTWTGSPLGVSLIASNWVDDGLIAYLNGVEVSRIRMSVPAPDPVTWDTLGQNPTEGLVEVVGWNSSALVEGENTVAIEVHQSSTTSSDVAFALALVADSPLSPIILDPTQPTNRTVFATRSTTLIVSAMASPAPTYQWYHNGGPIDPGVNPSAATAALVIANMQAADAGDYYCRVANVVGSVNSRTASVLYINDTTAPFLVEAGASATFDKISLQFDGPMDPSGANDSFNYSVSGGLTIQSATLNPDATSVRLQLDPLTPMSPDTQYTVTVAGLSDAAGNPIDPGNASVTLRSWVAGWCSGAVLETYAGPGTSVANLTGLAIYPNSPDFRTVIDTLDIRVAVDPANPTFYSTDARENYGGRIRGNYLASETGPHVFYFASDDNGEFWLSTDEHPSRKVLVARESVWSNSKEWTISGGSSSLAAKHSAPINLRAGHLYYFEALYKEGGGGDNCAVSVQLPSQATPPMDGADAIGAAYLGTVAPPNVLGPITIGQQPADLTVLANATATFTVVVSAPAFDGVVVPVCYQWRRDGVAIPGANGSTYSIALASLADDNTSYDCTLGIIGANATTRAALLRVSNDTIGPSCVSAAAGSSPSNIVVSFSEIVTRDSAEDVFNYGVSGFSVVSAVLQAGGSNVVLTVDGGVLEAGRNYSVTIQDVLDLSLNPIDPNPCTLSFSISTLGGYSATVLADNPVAYYRFNEAPPTANNAGSLGAAANGAYNGGATSGSEAPRPPAFAGLEPGNTALQCNGTDAFVGVANSLMNSRPVFTISGWMRRNADQNNRTGLWGQNDIVEFGYIANSTLEVWTDNGLDIPNAIPNGEWAHLAIVSDGSPGTISMYTNGVLAGSRAHTLPADNAFPFNIGGGGVFDAIAANGNYFNGQIDEVAVFGTALPAAKILAQYQSAFVEPGYSFNDGFLPPGTVASGTTPPYVLNGVLHLTDTVGSQANFWTIPLSSLQSFGQFSARWRTLIDTVGGADGLSFNVGQNVGTGFTPEDGGANGLSVCVDTYNNGAGDAGLDIKYNGVTLTHLRVPEPPAPAAPDGAGSPAALAIGQFVDTEVSVTSSGFVTFRYATFVITAQIPNYSALTVNEYVFAARTGGANENCWIDDVIIRGTALAGPTIATRPADQSVFVGQTATFSVVADGTAPLGYQWLRKLASEADFSPIAGATSASYTTPATVHPGDDNSQFKVQVSDVNGTVNSSAATLHVVPLGSPLQLWTVGKKDNGWPAGDGGGSNASFVQENGVINDLPGSPTSPEIDQQADNDYYFAGSYTTVVAGNGAYAPVGTVAANEEAAERAFAGGDLDLRYHFNLPSSLLPTDQISVTFSAINLDDTAAADTRRFGAEVYFNGVKIQDEILIRPPQLGTDYTTPRFSLGSVGAQTGPGADNIVSLRGISYNADGGGNWMGIDYVQLNAIQAPPTPTAVAITSPADGATVDACATATICANASAAGGASIVQVAFFANGTTPLGVATSAPYCVNVPNAPAGVYVLSAIATDSNGNSATSAPVNVTVVDRTPPVVTCPADIAVQATSPAGAEVTWAPLAATDACGVPTVGCTPMRGSVFPIGMTTVNCTATDGAGLTATCSFKVTVTPVDTNRPPVAVISSEQLIDLKPEYDVPVLLSCNWWNACLVADGWSSSDPEGGNLTYLWSLAGDPVPFGTGPVVTNCLEVGRHTIILTVTDPEGLSGTDNKTIEVVTAPLAIEILIEQINESHKSGVVLSRKTKRELTETLRVALAHAGREELRATQKALDAFEKKVRAQVVPTEPEAATAWIRWSQAVSEGMEKCIKPPRKSKDHHDDKKDDDRRDKK